MDIKSASKNIIPTPAVIYRYYKLFSSYDKNKFHLLIAVIVVSGLLEGIGITIFIPLLNYTAEASSNDQFSVAIFGIMRFFGLPINLFSIIFLLCFVFILKGIFVYIKAIVSSRISANLSQQFRDSIMKRYFKMNYLFFTEKNIGYFSNIITKIVEGVVGGFVKFSNAITLIFYIFIYLFFAFMINIQITVFAITIGLLILFLFRSIFNRSRSFSERATDTYSGLQEYSIQILNNFKYLKATHTYKYFADKYKNQINELSKLHFKLGALNGIFPSIGEPIIMVLMGCIVFFQITVKGETLAETLVLLVFFNRTFTRIITFQGSWQKFIGQLGPVVAFEKVKVELSENTEKINNLSASIPSGDIVFKNVFFSFGEKQVLAGINLIIKKKLMRWSCW